jgi:hypothetical protein
MIETRRKNPSQRPTGLFVPDEEDDLAFSLYQERANYAQLLRGR